MYWVDFGEPDGSKRGYRHPHIIIQNNLFNFSKTNTVIVCSLTSNLKRANSPGNILLGKGEANLSKKSVINISQIYTINKADLIEKIGQVSGDRLAQILDGIKIITEPREI